MTWIVLTSVSSKKNKHWNCWKGKECAAKCVPLVRMNSAHFKHSHFTFLPISPYSMTNMTNKMIHMTCTAGAGEGWSEKGISMVAKPVPFFTPLSMQITRIWLVLVWTAWRALCLAMASSLRRERGTRPLHVFRRYLWTPCRRSSCLGSLVRQWGYVFIVLSCQGFFYDVNYWRIQRCLMVMMVLQTAWLRCTALVCFAIAIVFQLTVFAVVCEFRHFPNSSAQLSRWFKCLKYISLLFSPPHAFVVLCLFGGKFLCRVLTHIHHCSMVTSTSRTIEFTGLWIWSFAYKACVVSLLTSFFLCSEKQWLHVGPLYWYIFVLSWVLPPGRLVCLCEVLKFHMLLSLCSSVSFSRLPLLSLAALASSHHRW